MKCLISKHTFYSEVIDPQPKVFLNDCIYVKLGNF